MYDKRKPAQFKFEQKPHVLIVQSAFCPPVAEQLHRGAVVALERAGATLETVDVPGVLEMAAAVVYAVKSLDFDAVRRRFDGFLALGCALKGETDYHHIIGQESIRALQDVGLQYSLALGIGVLTCDTLEQAMKRAAPDDVDYGGRTADACLTMIELKHKFRLTAKRRWVGK
ncbi:MAG TPA: 6,7-dimethyl-8-ribityllumazine synthase [Alphaproteobacteria bacterium]|nr:6,7-dimethyl-8-ribityllumazine synthase [Alphaproteobacteria bacterium]